MQIGKISWVLMWLCGVTAVIAGSESTNPKEKADGWTLLFDGKTTTGWHSFKKTTFPEKGWEVENGWLHCLGKGGGDIISDKTFDDFELQWEWKQGSLGNSGIKYFVLETRVVPYGHEYQMIDDKHHEDAQVRDGKRVTAGVYDVLKPTPPVPTKPPGEINQSRLIVHGNHVEHWLNGAKVLAYECGSAALKAAIAESKFKEVAGFGEKVNGHILLQDHRTEVWFRNVKIRTIPAK